MRVKNTPPGRITGLRPQASEPRPAWSSASIQPPGPACGPTCPSLCSPTFPHFPHCWARARGEVAGGGIKSGSLSWVFCGKFGTPGLWGEGGWAGVPKRPVPHCPPWRHSWARPCGCRACTLHSHRALSLCSARPIRRIHFSNGEAIVR